MAKWIRQKHDNVKIPLADGMTMTVSGEYPTCSECGFGEVGLSQETNYCPNCGARMGDTFGDKERVRQLVAALRCSCETAKMHDEKCCEGCLYYCKVSEEEMEEFCKISNSDKDSLPPDFWYTCDCDGMVLEAADLIERMVFGKEG